MRKARLIGLAITAALLAIGVGYFRPPRTPLKTAAPRPVRGGQVVASIRADATSFNPLVTRDDTSTLLALLTQGTLVRVNRATFRLEPWLAERWDTSADGRTYTLHLRDGLTWSDGAALTADDVVFSVAAALAPVSRAPVAAALTVEGRPIRATVVDTHTVSLVFPADSGQGLRLLDQLPILPKHVLEPRLRDGTFHEAWNLATPPAELVGSGPFLLRAREPGQRITLERNPRYWRKAETGDALPYLDRLVLEVVPDASTELPRLLAGNLDLTADALRPEDVPTATRADDEGRLKLDELGVSLAADALWFCQANARLAFVRKVEFRQALSHVINREAYSEQVYGTAAVPVWGPVTPGNRAWFWAGVMRYAPSDTQAHDLLKAIGLEDRNHDGTVEDAAGTAAHFTLLTERGLPAFERGTAFVTEAAARIGITFEVMPVEAADLSARLATCDYDAMFARPRLPSVDPAGSLDFWLSSGAGHFWQPAQKAPATDWERRIDTLMLEQAAIRDPARRRETFNLVQRILGDNVPVIYLAAPRLFFARHLRVAGVTPSPLSPGTLWMADEVGRY